MSILHVVRKHGYYLVVVVVWVGSHDPSAESSASSFQLVSKYSS